MEYYDDLNEAIKVDRNITKENIKQFKSIEKWRDIDTTGLVYDSQGLLVWDRILTLMGEK